MVLRHLRYFVAVAEEGSVARAPTKLHLAQPALSRQIQGLEREVGTPLFERARRGVKLTPAGAVLLRGVEVLLVSVEQSIRRAKLAHEGKLGTRRIALGRIAVHNRQIGRAIAQIRERYPEVQLVVTELPSFAQVRALRTGDVDLGIGVHGSTRDSGVRHEVLQADAVDRVLIPANHRLANAKIVEPQQLAGEQLLMMRPAAISGFAGLFEALQELGFSDWDEYDWPETVYGLVAAGRGFTTHVRSIQPTPAGTVAVPLKGLNVPLDIVVRWNESDASRLTSNLVALLRAEAGNEASAPRPAAPKRRESQPRTEHGATPQIPDVELRQLRSFVVTLEERSLSAAAPRLQLTQSGLSRQIRALEHELEFPLLERETHGVKSTAAGDVFHDEVVAIFAHIDDLLAQTRGVTRGITGRCKIGAIPELAGELLVGALRDVNTRFPEIAVEVREIMSGLQIAALLENRIDLALADAYPGLVDNPAIESAQLSSDVVDSALLSASHPLAKRASLTPAELANEPFIFVSRNLLPKLYDTVMEAFARIGLVPRLNEPVDGPRAIWRLTADGMGWTVGARSLRHKPLPGLVAVPIDGFHVPSGVQLLWRRDEENASVQAVLRAFRGQGQNARAPITS